MALLDVSEVISDPLFTSTITAIKTVEDFDEHGNPVWVDTMPVQIKAVVTSDSKVIERLPDELRRSGSIVVRFNVREAPHFQGAGYDAICWNGRRFVVVDSVDYSQFGSGFIRLICNPEDISNGNY